MSSQALMKVLTSPSKIASKLNWKKHNGSILSLDIHKDRIGVAVGIHPSLIDTPTIKKNKKNQYYYGSNMLESNEGNDNNNNKSNSSSSSSIIWTMDPPFMLHSKTDIPNDCLSVLSSIVDEHNVCGIVVSWPIQQDTGKMGASCGRVVYTLNQILKHTKDLITPSRPLCLWDIYRHYNNNNTNNNHSTNNNDTRNDNNNDNDNTKNLIDKWGRSVAYCQTTNKHIHFASKEQYNQDENIVATQVWDAFCRAHWPELYDDTGAFAPGNNNNNNNETISLFG